MANFKKETMSERFAKLASYLKTARVRANLSQTDVAKKLGFTGPQFVSNWERGLAAPPLTSLKKLAGIYGIDPESVFKMILSEVEAQMREEFGSRKA